MTPEQLEELRDYRDGALPIPPADGEDRTLLFGWNIANENNRTTMHHVYLKDGEINLVLYHQGYGIHPTEVVRHAVGDEISLSEIVPNKRLYPEACDFEYCKALAERQASLSFTTPGRLNEIAEGDVFYGVVAENAPAPRP